MYCTKTKSRALEFLMLASMAAVAVACGDDAGNSGGGSTQSTTSTTSTASSPTGPGAGGTGGASSTGTSTGGASSTGTSVGGAGGAGGFVAGDTQCSDGIDNDSDGFVDSADPECVGPLDNDESSFATGIPGDNKDPCRQDCFFDGNSGAGDDKCDWNLKCDEKSPGAPKCPYDANYKNCPETQADICIDVCKTITPNGCDCFGCCEVYFDDGTSKQVYIGSEGCSSASPENCKECTPTDSCNNPCETCELCLGKETLPPECQGGTGGSTSTGTGGSGGGVQQCADGVQACGQAGQSPCQAGSYCITGCCQVIPK